MRQTFDSDFYKKILDKINTNIYITDIETDEIIYMSDYMKKTFRLDDIEGKICWKVLQNGMKKRCDFCKIDQLRKSGIGNSCIWKEKNTVTGRVYLNHDSLESWNGRVYHIQNSMDITDQIQLSMEASIDELTGVLNRNAGKKRLEDILKGMEGEEWFTVALYDINGLKWVNDTYGHLEGDRLLVFVAQNIQKELDGTDFIFRLSGDEFIVVFMNKTAAEAEMWMKKILKTLDERRTVSGIDYDVAFSYGFASIYAGENLSVSDVLSIADTQMYIQKRDHHIMMGKKRLEQDRSRMRGETLPPFQYNKDYLFEALAESIDDYLFVGNLKTGRFMYSYKMMVDFQLPNQVLANAAAFWGEKIHPDDAMMFLRSNQEIADGRVERHTIAYRAKAADGTWVPLLCRGKMIRDELGNPDLFAGIIRNLDRSSESQDSESERKDRKIAVSQNEVEQFIDSIIYSGYHTELKVCGEQKEEVDNARESAEERGFYFMDDTEGEERRKTEAELLNFVNRNIPGGILTVYDKPGFPLFCFNHAVLEYTHYTCEEFKEISKEGFGNVIYPGDRKMVDEEMARQLQKNSVYEVRYRIVCSGGKLIWVYERGRYVTDENGRRMIMSFFVDISHEMESEQELRFITDNSMDGIFKAAMTEGFPLLYANDGYYQIHGYTREQLKEERHNCAAPLVYEEDINRVQREIGEIIYKKERHVVLEYRIKKRDGEMAWVHVDAGLTTLLDGTMAMIGMVMDITKRRSLEERLRRTQQLFMIAKKHTRLSMWEFDIENHRIIQTKESMEIHGFGEIVENVPEGLISKNYVDPESIPAIRKLYREVAEGKEEATAVIRVKAKERPEEYWWEKITYTIVQRVDGKPVWAIGGSEDVTAQKEAEIRVFKEETMRQLLAEDLLFRFRVNMSRQCLEEAWTYTGEAVENQMKQFGYDQIYQRVAESIANEDDRKRFQVYYTADQLSKYAKSMTPIPDFEFRQKQRDGMILWVALNMRMIVSPSSGELILFGYGRNMDLQKKRELALQKKAEIDEVSGFYNDVTVRLLIQNILKSDTKKKGISALALLDADDFKEVNLTGGFLTGDQILRQMSDEIRKKMSAFCVIGRQSKDVFVLFYYNMKSEQEIYESVEEIRSALCRRYIVEEYETDLHVSAGIAYHFSEDFTYEQLYQCAQLALDTAKRSGKNLTVSYREDCMDSGSEPEMMIDLETYRILYMNPAGQSIFGLKEPMGTDKKCYELLHSRTEPCSFCSRKISFEKPYIWECFISRLNKMMYVQECLALRDGQKVRQIRLREVPFQAENETADENTGLYKVMGECWTEMEKGSERTTVFLRFVRQIGSFYRAHRILMFRRKEPNNDLEPDLIWTVNGLEESGENVGRESRWLEDALYSALPEMSIFIQDKTSIGYEQVEKYYGTDGIPGHVILIGTLEGEQLVSCILLENVCRDVNSLKQLEMIAGFMQHIQNIYDLQKRYEYVLSHDKKTGLFNYECYMNYLENANEDVYSSLGMVGVRIVDLKGYNQKYGANQGDELLRFAADLLKENFGADFCYRVSGANFLVLCPDITYENFVYRCEKLERQIEQSYPGWMVSQRVWEQQALSVEKLQRQIEEKMKVAENKKRNEESYVNDQSVSEIMKGLGESIHNGGFCTFLQPKAETGTNKICGAEALVRYHHREKGIIPPARFLPGIERAGLIRYVDLFVLEDVCRMMREWIDNGWEPFPISLNFSRTTILEPGILNEANRIAECFGIPKELIEIEITETIGSIDSVSLKDIVRQFTEAGYKIALDDFGAEYSNIYVLYSLALDSLKLDRRIVSDIYHDSRARLVVENVIGICKKLNITCVAEGVETAEHLEVLNEMMCDVIQGYYLNKPLAEEDFRRQYVKEK